MLSMANVIYLITKESKQKFTKSKLLFTFKCCKMKVHIIKKQTIEGYITKNIQSSEGFRVWLSIVKHADWKEPLDIVHTYNSADILGNGSNRVVFNIGGNKYRLICSYHFGSKMTHLFICWIGTHAEYDKLCKRSLQYTINDY